MSDGLGKGVWRLLYDLAEHHVRGRAVQISRKVWTYPSIAEQPTVAILFLDAELYLERVEAIAVLERLQREGRVPPSVAAFVSNNGAAARHVDFTCDRDYATFVAKDLTAWIRERHASVHEIVLAGLSLSGLAAAFATTRFPRKFAATICQSPSFWWEDGQFYKELPNAAEPGQKMWVCVGDREIDANVSHSPTGMFQKLTQIEGCDSGCAALRLKGYEVSYRKYAGGHDPICWREDLMLALPWACGQFARPRNGNTEG